MVTQDITNIPSDRVPFFDARTGAISREWYRFLVNLYTYSNSAGNYTQPPEPIVVTTSPFIYTNDTRYSMDVVVAGGGVTALEFSRDGSTWINTGSYYGMFGLSPGDKIRLSYYTAPTVTFIPR